MKPSLYLIDGHAQIYRAYYAMESLKTAQGVPTGAAFGFARMIADILQNQRPDGLIAVFDAPGKTFRHEEYPDYKATRKSPPPELTSQIPLILDIVEAYNIPIFRKEGFEADDIMGTLACRAKEQGWDVVLVTGDKDCGQLLCDAVKIYDPAKGVYTDVQAFTEKKGLPPEKLIDLMGLWGDASDNIPGVPGIGEKIGVQLISQYGSLENLLENAHEIKGKRGEVLRAHRDQALLSKRLATIDCNVPVVFDPEAARPGPPDTPRLRELFTQLNFKSLLSRLEDPEGAPPKKEEVDYRLVDDVEKFTAFLAELANQPMFSFDTETTGLDPLQDELVGLGFSWEPRTAYYLPFRGPAECGRLPMECLDQLKPIFADPSIGKTGHNVRFDALVLRHAGVPLAGVRFDSLIASSLVDGHLVDHGLKTLARRYFDVEMTPIQDLIGTGRKQGTIDNVPVADVCAYCGADADITYRLYEELGRRLDERGGRDLFETVELPLSDVLTTMQATGIRLDADLLREQSDETGELLDGITQEIYELVGHEFNIGSPKQLSVVLYEEMGLPILKKTQTGASTDEAVLQELAHLHQSEVATRILEYRMYAKLKNTYLDALPRMVNPHTGRLHTSFSQVRTATGRLASSNPNLQNIPVRTERGRAVRAAFVPEPGWQMLAADYSQVELRVLASFSGDPVLAQAFADGMDIHRVVAAQVNGIAPDEVTKEQRSAAKAVNFGIIYGQSAHGLSAVTGMTRAQAQKFIDDYFDRFPKVREWMAGALAEAEEHGYVETVLKFRREIPDIRSSNKMRRSRAEREAINTIIQGSAADLIKTAMVRLARALEAKSMQARMLLQIHDELLLEAPPEEMATLRDVVTEAMVNAIPLAVPLQVDIGVGENWLETK